MKTLSSYKKAFRLEDISQNKEQIIKFYRNYGFIHIKSFFTRKEIYDLKKTIISRIKNVDSLDCRHSSNLFISEKINRLLSLVIQGKVIYPFLSKLSDSQNPTQQSKSLYHVDTRNDDFNFKKEYNIVNTGVYFNNYKDNSGGLKISPGSHKFRDFEDYSFIGRLKKHIRNKQFLKIFIFQKSYNVPLEIGDFILWNVRTHHSGHVKLIKVLKRMTLHPVFENILPKFFSLSKEKDRKLITTIYAEDCEYYNKYFQYQLMTHNVDIWKNTSISKEQIKFAKANNFQLEKRCLKLMNIK